MTINRNFWLMVIVANVIGGVTVFFITSGIRKAREKRAIRDNDLNALLQMN